MDMDMDVKFHIHVNLEICNPSVRCSSHSGSIRRFLLSCSICLLLNSV